MFGKSAKQESSLRDVEMVDQCEGNNREDEVGVLCEGEVNDGSSNVREDDMRAR